MRNAIYLSSALAIIWFVFLKEDNIKLEPGVLAPQDPAQTTIDKPDTFVFKNYTISPLAKFNITAKVLSKKSYHFGRESDLSPFDLALGWGNMSDESVVDSIDISQSGRWYNWRVEKFPISKREIETHSANMHLIPAEKWIKSAIGRARKGDIVEISGSLVRVDAKDGWHWISSLSRKDTGSHACELFWVEDFSVQHL